MKIPNEVMADYHSSYFISIDWETGSDPSPKHMTFFVEIAVNLMSNEN